MKIERRETKLNYSKSKITKRKKGSLLESLGLSSGGGKEVEEIQSAFASSLLEAEEISSRKELDAVIKEIDEAGRELIRKPVPEKLKIYKAKLQKFMKKIVEDSFIVREKMSRKSIIEEKIYIIVEKIDEKLEELTEELLNNQAETLNLASKLDEIRGLLIDTYK